MVLIFFLIRSLVNCFYFLGIIICVFCWIGRRGGLWFWLSFSHLIIKCSDRSFYLFFDYSSIYLINYSYFVIILLTRCNSKQFLYLLRQKNKLSISNKINKFLTFNFFYALGWRGISHICEIIVGVQVKWCFSWGLIGGLWAVFD